MAEIHSSNFWLGDWRVATEYTLRIWNDPEFVKIEESEAMRLIPSLLISQQFAASRSGFKPEFVPASIKTPDAKPLSSLTTLAVAMHELFLSFKSAGFNEDQALLLVRDLFTNSLDNKEEAN